MRGCRLDDRSDFQVGFCGLIAASHRELKSCEWLFLYVLCVRTSQTKIKPTVSNDQSDFSDSAHNSPKKLCVHFKDTSLPETSDIEQDFEQVLQREQKLQTLKNKVSFFPVTLEVARLKTSLISSYHFLLACENVLFSLVTSGSQTFLRASQT